MSEEHERFISDENDELKRIREAKLRQMMERKQEMNAKPVHVTDATFGRTVKENKLALIDFWASWCGPCLALAPVIEELARDYAGKVFVGKLDVDENSETAASFQVYSVPTVVLMKNGKEVDRVVGCVPKQEIENVIKKHME